MEPVFTADFRVRTFEADWEGRARPVALLNYLQDAAHQHANLLQVGVEGLRSRQLTWVLVRYALKFLRYPEMGEDVRVRTWPSAREGMYTWRDFELRDASGEVLMAATSSWALLDLKSLRPVRLKDRLGEYPLLDRRALMPEAGKIPLPEGPADERVFRVRRTDLDLNRHVNNSVYAEWALESVPEETALGWRPLQMEISFRRPAFHGDTVVVHTRRVEQGEHPAFVHLLVRQEDGLELTRLRTRWQPAAGGDLNLPARVPPSSA